MSNLFKYPRTLHFPWSEHMTTDDKIMSVADVDLLKQFEVVVTEKMDGENTSMYSDHFHARSLDSRHHPSRDFVKATWGAVKHLIPEGWRVCGENMYAKHSIHYKSLTSYFYVFGIYTNKNICLSWDNIEEKCEEWGLKTVPVIYKGPWDDDVIKNCFTGQSNFGAAQEGYVVRTVDGFAYEDHAKYSAKMVRENHVQTSQFWMNEAITPNKIV